MLLSKATYIFRLYIFLSGHVFPGNRTHNLCAANAMLNHWATGTPVNATVCSTERRRREKNEPIPSPGSSKSNQIKSLLLSHHHSTSALVSEILMSVLQTVQKKTKKTTTIYIWTVHIYRLYRRQCAKYTYIYSVHTVYYKDILRYQCTNTHYTPYLHVCIMSTSMHSNMWRCNRL